jgi:hypothetical protein
MTPLYTDFDTLPFGTYLKVQRTLRDTPIPKGQYFSLTAMVDCVALLYGLTDQQLAAIPHTDFWTLVEGIAPLLSGNPPALKELDKFEWEGKVYRFETEPRDMTVLQMKQYEEVMARYPDPLDQQVICVSWMAYPEDQPEYSYSRFGLIPEVYKWPTSVCITALSFFVNAYGLSSQLTRLSTALEALTATAALTENRR